MEEKSYDYVTYPRQFLSYRWFKPILVALLVFVFMFLFQLVLFFAATLLNGGDMDYLIDLGTDYDSMDAYTAPSSLVLFGSVAALLPALAIATLIVRDRPFSSYSSSRGGWNWPAFLKCMALALVLVGIPGIAQIVLFPDPNATGTVVFTVAGLLFCVALIPLQCLAEEYIFRGLAMQTFGSWTKLPVLGIIIQAAVFAACHPYNILGVIAIFCSGLVWGFVTWQTKGLEASGAAHIVNNLVAFGTTGLGLTVITSEVDMVSLIVSLIIDIVYGVAILIADRKFGWFTPQGDVTAAFNDAYRAKVARKHQMGAQPPSQELFGT